MTSHQEMMRKWTAEIEKVGQSLTAGGYKGSRKEEARFTYKNTEMCNFIELAPDSNLIHCEYPNMQ